MNARDDYPPETIDGKQHDAMCAELDELRAQVAAVNAALDQFDILKGRRLFTAHETLAMAVAKAVGR
jgi:hypothetical protein